MWPVILSYFPPVRVFIRAYDAELANQIPSIEPWPMTRLSCIPCSITQRLWFSKHTAKGPKNQRTCTKHALDIIQSFSHNHLLGWQGQRCAALACSPVHKQEYSFGKKHEYKPKPLAKTINRRNTFYSCKQEMFNVSQHLQSWQILQQVSNTHSK